MEAMATTPTPESTPQPVATEPVPVAAGVEAPAPASEGGDVSDFSLADLAGLDVSGIDEIRFERVPDGKYVFRGKEIRLDEDENDDGDKRFNVFVVSEVVECHVVLEQGVTKEDTIGKTHTERFFVDPTDAATGIGRIRAFIADIGLPNVGALGGMASQGKAPGILDQIPGHQWPATIFTQKRKGQEYARMKLTPPKK